MTDGRTGHPADGRRRGAAALLLLVAVSYAPDTMRHAELLASYGPALRRVVLPAGDPTPTTPDPSIPDYLAEVTLRGVPDASRVPVGSRHYAGSENPFGLDRMAAFVMPDGALVEANSYGAANDIEAWAAWQGAVRFVVGVPRTIRGADGVARLTINPIFVDAPVEFVRGQRVVYDYAPTGFVRSGTAPMRPPGFYTDAEITADLERFREERLVRRLAIGGATVAGVLAGIAAVASRKTSRS